MLNIAKQLNLPSDVSIEYDIARERYILAVEAGGVVNVESIRKDVIAEKRSNAELYAFMISKADRMRREITDGGASQWNVEPRRSIAEAIDAYEGLVGPEKFSAMCQAVQKAVRDIINDNPA